MLLIDRYVGRAALVTTLYGLLVLSFVLVLGNIFKEALDLLINRSVPLGYLLFFIACVLPFSMIFTIPWSFLTAVLLVFGRMSADHETVALRACGISLLRVAVPVLVAGLAFSGLCLWLNMSVAPRAELAMRESLAAMARSNPLALFTPNEVVDQFRGRKLFVGSRDGNDLGNITIIEQDPGAKPKTIIHALRGRVEKEEGDDLNLILNDALVENRVENRPDDLAGIQHGIFVKEVEVAIPLTDLVNTSLLWRPLRTYQMPELLDLLHRDIPEEERISKTGILTEISKRFSLSVASLAFAFIAIPLGMVAQRRETSAGFAISLVVAFSYFFFVALADMLRENPAAYPYLLLWVPNVLCIGIGTWLLLRMDAQ